MEQLIVKNLDGENLVTQSNNLVEARYFMSKNEQLILLAMVSFVDPKDKEFLTYKTSISQFSRLLNIDEKSSKREILNITERLISRTVTIDSGNEWLVFNWVTCAKASIKEDSLILKFNNELKPYLLDLKSRFTSFKLDEIIELKSLYSIRIYQILKDFNGRKIYKFTYDLLDFREIVFGNKSKKYPAFKDFRVNILDKPKKELDEKSSLSFTYETIRVGRRIGKIQFTIVKKYTNTKKRENKEIAPKQPPIEIIPKESIDPATQTPEFQRMHTLGIPKNQALYFVKKYDAVYIQGKFNVLEYKQKKEVVDNPAGFLIRAMKENWKSEDLIRQQMEQQKVKIQRKKEAEQKRIEALKERREQLKKEFSIKTRTQFLKTLSTMEKEFLKTEFLKTVSGFTRKSLPKDDIDKLLLSPFFVLELTPYIPNYEEDKQRYIDENL